MQFRPCGQGVVDCRAVLAVIAANPDVNLTIENEEPSEEATSPMRPGFSRSTTRIGLPLILI